MVSLSTMSMGGHRIITVWEGPPVPSALMGSSLRIGIKPRAETDSNLQVDPQDSNIVYAQSQHGGLTRFDKKSGENLGIKPKPRKGEKDYRWNWDAPLLVSPHSHTRLYFAANKVFRSDDRGSTWKVISDDLTRQIDRNKLEVMGRVWPMDAVAKNASTSQYGTIVALDESPVAGGSHLYRYG